MSKIVKGYWKCNYCGTKDIDGLIDICPNCGKQKSHNVKYYMKEGVVEYVTPEQLNNAGIKESECDGDHEDWVCPYCDQLNNYSDTACVACGGLKSEAVYEYGGNEIDKPDLETETSSSIYDTEWCSEESTSETQNDDISPSETTPVSPLKALKNKISNIPMNKFATYAVSSLVGIAILGFICMLFWPTKEIATVTDFTWTRTITVEEERTVKENDWSIPTDGRIYDERQEIKTYVQVLDHYETTYETKTREILDHYDTVYETRTRQVIDHYDTHTSYSDNGNGTFTEHSYQTPVYTTETYQEAVQKPVYRTETYQEAVETPIYRDEPVYATKYYYEIERWFEIATYTSSNNDKEPFWSTEYTLSENQRDTMRTETYIVIYDNGNKNTVSYGDWLNISEGDTYVITTCMLGIVYKQELKSEQ